MIRTFVCKKCDKEFEELIPAEHGDYVVLQQGLTPDYIKCSGKVVDIEEEQKRAEEVLDELLQVEEGLNEKELGFIEDMNHKRSHKWTKKQIGWLDIIHEKYC